MMRAWRMRPARRALPGLAFGAALAILFACTDNRVAGGTDEVENPALTASLRDGPGQGVTGTLLVYARFQNPGKDSLPVLSVTGGSGEVTVRAKSLLAAMDTAAQAGIPWKNRDSLEFNLVGRTASDEAFAADYLLVKSSAGTWAFRRIRPPEGGGLYATGSLSTRLTLAAAVKDYKGSIGGKGLELGLKKIFIAGSPYHAAVVSDGSFTVPRMAAGRYGVKALDGSGKAYEALDSLSTDAPFSPSNWSEADIIWVDQ